MIKHAKVEVGKTPSEVSGKPSTRVVEGVPLADGEQLPEKRLEKSSVLTDHTDCAKSRQ